MANDINSNFLENAVDELERMAVEEAIKRRCFNPNPTALVVPDGRCNLSFELARKGVLVTAADAGEWDDDDAACLYPATARSHVRFEPITLTSVGVALPNEPFDLIFCSRGFCALPYSEARETVRTLLRKLKIGGRLYLSVLGLHSELSNGYTDVDKDVHSRYCQLKPELAEKYAIPGPICLYTERNFFTLILEAGGGVLRSFTTTHGNVKGVAVRI